MNCISVPANVCKRSLLEKSRRSFYIGKDRVAILNLIDYLGYIKTNLYSKMNKSVSFKIDTFKSWMEVFYNLQKNNESTFLNRFLSKELLFRKILLEKFFSKELINPVDETIRLNINDSVVCDNIQNALSDLKQHNIFFNSKFFNKEIKDSSALNFYTSMVLGMPFNEEFYKIWVDNFEIYSLGGE